MGGAIPAIVTAFGATAGAGLGTAAAGVGRGGENPKEKGPADENATGQDAADEDGSSVDAGEGAARTGLNRCPRCRHRGERYCRHR
jgi:hypothetical protein